MYIALIMTSYTMDYTDCYRVGWGVGWGRGGKYPRFWGLGGKGRRRVSGFRASGLQNPVGSLMVQGFLA